KVLEGVNFLKKSGALSSTVDAELKKWFSEFQVWLINSKNGIDEKFSGNNHSTWFAVQMGAIAQYLRDNNVLTELFDHTKNYLIENQFEADGSMPREEARTLSLHYSVFNLDAFSIILRQAELSGAKLWDYENSKKSSFKKSTEYVTPFLRDPESWTKPQINEYKGENRIYLAFAGWGLDDANLLGFYKEFLEAHYGKLDSDPFTLLTSLILINDERK
ncbi:MAG: alginate lyase family protein, partial [Ignavibacteria bacterium]|nr:alginate lyase family protein [Ignavibacteria bacterium]